MKPLLILLSLLFSGTTFSQDTMSVYFIYGSKPLTNSESHWFGGKLGGHVGMGPSEDSVFHFNPGGKVGAFGHKDKPGTWNMNTKEEFLCTFGCDSNKILTVRIPITAYERESIRIAALEFMENSPYPYAFFGMRCTSSCYHLLSKTHWFNNKGKSQMVRNYFYPRKLRKELLKDAKKFGWETELTIGRTSRKWDHD